MFTVKLNVLLFLMICYVSYCQRRIQGGVQVTANKPYVVYLVKATLSQRVYDSWLCGGAIVNSDFVITSAACVEDVEYMFVVAGYNKYVHNDQLEEDPCTSRMKKKVVFTCVPESYSFDFDRIDKWSQIDIALVKVESSYDFQDADFEKYCTYIPTRIAINYDAKYQMPDTDCMVMGWGHDKKWRQKIDSSNNNSDILKYTSTLVLDKAKCIEEYKYYPEMEPIIDQYMICTSGVGVIDDAGEPKEGVLDPSTYTMLDGCVPGRRMDQQNSSCYRKNNGHQNTDINMNARREVPKTNRTYYNYTMREYIKKAARERSSYRTRRNGICQNDHGGPLVTWVGTSEYLIGIASVFQIDPHFNCVGPYLHTSTQKNAAFIECVLNDWHKDKARRSAVCDSPPKERGFDMIENQISWKDHPSGPAENELREAKFGPH